MPHYVLSTPIPFGMDPCPSVDEKVQYTNLYAITMILQIPNIATAIRGENKTNCFLSSISPNCPKYLHYNYNYNCRDGHVRLFSFRSYIVRERPILFVYFQYLKKFISFVIKVIVYFLSISFVFSLNDRSIQQFVR